MSFQGLCMTLLMTIMSCSAPDGPVDNYSNMGSVKAEQVVAGRARWRNFLSNVTGYTFALNDNGLVDSIFFDDGYAVFEYRDEYQTSSRNPYNVVEMKIFGIDRTPHTNCMFNIGTNGYAKNATENNLLTGKSYTWTFSYDQRGYLTALNAGGDRCEFEYMDGNIVEYTNYVDTDETLYFTYSSLQSMGYMPYFHAPGYIEEDFGPILQFAYLAGLAGRPANNLPTSCERVQEFYDKYWLYEYKYTFSNEGNLVGLYYLML